MYSLRKDGGVVKNYINNSLINPKYLFHGSPKCLEIVEQRQAHDSNGNSENEDYAVFLTSSFLIATAYAFKDKIKSLSAGKNWNFEIGGNLSGEIFIKMDNVTVDDSMEGYIYIFDYSSKYYHEDGTLQYKCYEEIKPIDVVKIKFSDFKEYYTINENQKNKLK